jgi:hypothetical protein
MRATKIPAPHIQQARELLKRELQITREDVAHGYQEAIHMARIQSDALTMIIGWEKTAKRMTSTIRWEVTCDGEVMHDDIQPLWHYSSNWSIQMYSKRRRFHSNFI